MKLTVGSCFSGIGGLELGLEWSGGFETRWQIENDDYASRVLAKHWPNVKRYADIRDVSFPERVDVVCGGFPCQDVSLAGARAGLEGKRSTLWGEMFRLVCEVGPTWVVAENVPGLLSSDDGRFFGNILRDLASAGYDAEWGVLSATGVGAPHLRRRIFIVAYATSEQDRRIFESGFQPDVISNNENVRDSKRIERKKRLWETGEMETPASNKFRRPVRWNPAPRICRAVDRIPNRLERLRCLGNAVVPQVAQKIGEMILESL